MATTICTWCSDNQSGIDAGLRLGTTLCQRCYDRERAHVLIDRWLAPLREHNWDGTWSAICDARDILTPCVIAAGLQRKVTLCPEDLGAWPDEPWVREWHAQHARMS